MRAMFAEPFGFLPRPYTPGDLKTALGNLLACVPAASVGSDGTRPAPQPGRSDRGEAR
jgi:hypothetical protein